MEDKVQSPPPPQGSYKIDNIILVRSMFQRNVAIDFSRPITLNFEHASEAQSSSTEDGKFGVGLEFTFKGLQSEIEVFSAEVKMIGVFEKAGEPAVPEETFKRVNAPAIIYPFIREHIHHLCLKAAVGRVLLPTVNFKI